MLHRPAIPYDANYNSHEMHEAAEQIKKVYDNTKKYREEKSK
jgi:hypothetical protein